MGLLDVDEEKLRYYYHRAWIEAGGGFVDPRKFPYLDKALYLYATEHGCTYDQALIVAETPEMT